MQSSTPTRSYESLLYGIGIAYGLGIDKDGKPQIHAINKLERLREMLESDQVKRAIITGLNESSIKPSSDYLVEKNVSREIIYGDKGRSFLEHMYHIRVIVDMWIKEGEIPPYVLLHHLVSESKNNHMSVERARFDVKWVIPKYASIVHGVEDGRPEEVIWEIDGSKEPERMRIDRKASKVPISRAPILSTYRPDLAQYVAILSEPSSWKTYLHRLLPRR